MSREKMTTTRVVLTSEEAAALVVLTGCEEAPGVLLPLAEVPVSPLDALRGTMALDAAGRVRGEVKEMMRILENPACCLLVQRQVVTGSQVEGMTVFYDSPVGPYVIANKSEDLRDLTFLPGPAELLAVLDDLGSLSADGGAELPELVLGADAFVALATAVDVVSQQRVFAEERGEKEVGLMLPEMTAALLGQHVRARKDGVFWLVDVLAAGSGGRVDPAAADVARGLTELKLLGLFDEEGQASELGAMWIAVLGQTKDVVSYQLASAMEGKSETGCLLRWGTAAGWLLGAFGEGDQVAFRRGEGAELVEGVLGLLEGPYLAMADGEVEEPVVAPPELPDDMDLIGVLSSEGEAEPVQASPVPAPPLMPAAPQSPPLPGKKSGGGSGCLVALIVTILVFGVFAVIGWYVWGQPPISSSHDALDHLTQKANS